jgi:hypothetical protein
VCGEEEGRSAFCDQTSFGFVGDRVRFGCGKPGSFPRLLAVESETTATGWWVSNGGWKVGARVR